MNSPWWKTLLVSLANLAVGAVVQHYLGDGVAAGTLAVGTAVAHALPSPKQPK